jgi:hypothetical protein
LLSRPDLHSTSQATMVAISAYTALFLSTVLSAHGATAQQSFLSSNLSAQEYLQTTTPNVVLSAEFPTPELHSAWEDWKGAFNRAYKSTKEGALRKLIWLQNHGVYMHFWFHHMNLPPTHRKFFYTSNNHSTHYKSQLKGIFIRPWPQ